MYVYFSYFFPLDCRCYGNLWQSNIFSVFFLFSQYLMNVHVYNSQKTEKWRKNGLDFTKYECCLATEKNTLFIILIINLTRLMKSWLSMLTFTGKNVIYFYFKHILEFVRNLKFPLNDKKKGKIAILRDLSRDLLLW